MRRQVPLETRFWSKVAKSTGDGCWLFTGAINSRGYGVINRGEGRGRNVLAHRLSWRLAHGNIPDGKLVLHTCDVRNCVRPDHLWLGTSEQNTRDMLSKGRRVLAGKLAPEDARNIRGLAESGMTVDEIAPLYPQVKRVSVWRVVTGRTFNPDVPVGPSG